MGICLSVPVLRVTIEPPGGKKYQGISYFATIILLSPDCSKMRNSYIRYPGQSLPLLFGLKSPAVVKLASDQIPRMPKSLNDQAWPRCEPESTSVFELSPVLREYSANLALKAEALYWPSFVTGTRSRVQYFTIFA